MVAMAIRQLATIILIFGIVLANLVFTYGKLECEDLPVEDCAFSVASSGTRCVLEKYKGKGDSIRYECQSSIIMAERQEEWIESDECVKSCGLERMSVGLSTDLLMDSHFTEMLCSSECLNNCPNLIDLYINLAAGEGMYLPQLCKTHRLTSRRSIADPVKKAKDTEYQKRVLQKLTSGGTIGPAASETPEIGAGTGFDAPPADGDAQRSGPSYRNYDYRGEITPTSPVSRDSTDVPPVQKVPGEVPTPIAGGPSTNKRPFFIASSAPTPSSAKESIPVAATPETGAVNIAPETAPGSGPEPVPEQGSEELYWQKLAAEKTPLDRSQLDDEEYLYETYFH